MCLCVYVCVYVFMCLCDDYAYFPAQATFFAAWGMGNQISLAERVLTKRGPSFWIPSDLGKILTGCLSWVK